MRRIEPHGSLAYMSQIEIYFFDGIGRPKTAIWGLLLLVVTLQTFARSQVIWLFLYF